MHRRIYRRTFIYHYTIYIEYIEEYIEEHLFRRTFIYHYTIFIEYIEEYIEEHLFIIIQYI